MSPSKVLSIARGDRLDVHSVSIIIPTFNGAGRIGRCLDALTTQALQTAAEILVVDDGSTDRTAMVVAKYPGVRLITQENAGPAAARNRGALEAIGTVLLFTDDDCVPTPDWLVSMLRPFSDSEVVGAKGIYRTLQNRVVARFVQLEYEDKYRVMSSKEDIDFIDTYSGAYRRDRFLDMKGFDTSFPVACAEDIELSYRMSALGWKMRFVPDAVVCHTHPETFAAYLKKKYKFAYWRMLAIRKNPGKAVSDSHTPQLMKLQVVFAPLLLGAAILDLTIRPAISALLVVGAAFLITTVPFVVQSFRNDPWAAILSPGLLAARACAQFAGVAAGLVHALVAPPVSSIDLPPQGLGG